MLEVRGFSSSIKALFDILQLLLQHDTYYIKHSGKMDQTIWKLRCRQVETGKKSKKESWKSSVCVYELEWPFSIIFWSMQSGVDSGSKGQNRDNPSHRQSAQSEQEGKKGYGKEATSLIWVWTPAGCKQILICSICHNSYWEKWNVFLWHCTRKSLHFYLKTLILKPFLRLHKKIWNAPIISCYRRTS